MLKLLSLTFRFICFSLFILVIAHLVEWNGRSVSDLIGDQVVKVKNSEIAKEAEGWARKKLNHPKVSAPLGSNKEHLTQNDRASLKKFLESND